MFYPIVRRTREPHCLQLRICENRTWWITGMFFLDGLHFSGYYIRPGNPWSKFMVHFDANADPGVSNTKRIHMSEHTRLLVFFLIPSLLDPNLILLFTW